MCLRAYLVYANYSDDDDYLDNGNYFEKKKSEDEFTEYKKYCESINWDKNIYNDDSSLTNELSEIFDDNYYQQNKNNIKNQEKNINNKTDESVETEIITETIIEHSSCDIILNKDPEFSDIIIINTNKKIINSNNDNKYEADNFYTKIKNFLGI